MNDYRELIGDIGDLLIAHPSEHISKRYLQKAADAIEQLVKERDAAIKDLKYLPLTTCKWVNTDRCKNHCLCERYEWRGVQE